MGGASTGSNAVQSELAEASKLVLSCPKLEVDMGGVKVPCLVDTGSMVSTVTEFHCYSILNCGVKSALNHVTGCSLDIPFLGYLELNVELCGKLISQCGVLVVRDSPGDASLQVSGVIGMNVIRRCYQELFMQHGLALFELQNTGRSLQS